MDAEPLRFDLVVIGSGPAGEKGAAQAAYFGKSVALVERSHQLGGAAANTGTLPSKTLRETALFLSGFRNRALTGVHMTFKHEVTVRDFMEHEQRVTAHERERIGFNLERHHVRVFQGAARFESPGVVVVDAPEGVVRLAADVVLVAVGSKPHHPPGYDFRDPRILDSDTILLLHDIPASMLVVGGGVIGCEYACMFAVLGVAVTIVESRDRLCGGLDAEVSRALEAQMRAMGVVIKFGETVAAVEHDDELRVTLKSGAVLAPSTILVSSGREGNSDSLGLEKIGVEPGDRGLIRVDARYRTSAPGVYAVGDVIGNPALASTAMEQARVAMVDAFQLKYKEVVAPILPFGIYTIPECSMAGETEETLRKQGVPYIVGRADYASNARGQIIGDSSGFLKLLFHRDDMRLLGVHVIGEQATELIHVGLTALLLRQTSDIFINTCYNYPTLSELYKYATYDALGRRARMLQEQPSDCETAT